jgi:hypothetical protein
MIAKPGGVVAKLGKRYSPNLDEIASNSKEALATFGFTGSPEHRLDDYPVHDWTVVVTNPRCVRAKYRSNNAR